MRKIALHITTLLCAVALASVSAAELGGKQEPMFDQHCYDCHDADAKKGGLDLTSLQWKPDDAGNLQQWIKVFDKVERGEMPPEKQDRPPTAVSGPFLKTLHDELHTFSRHKQEAEGRVVYR
ncbi:MAG: c-type cytochrome domain-containing protein, partial [Verrucomicrobiales bacterium]